MAWADRLASAALALLVAAAVALSARLWTSPLLERAAAPAAVAYVAPDGLAEVDPGELLLPVKIGVGYGDGAYGLAYPGSVAFDGYLWPLLARVAAAVPERALKAVDAAGLPAPWRERGAVYAEAVMPFAASPAEWRRLLQLAPAARAVPSAAPAAGPGPAAGGGTGAAGDGERDGMQPQAVRADRLLLVAGAGRALLAWRYPGGALVFDAADAGVPDPAARSVREAAASLGRTLPLLRAAGTVAAELLPEQAGGLRLEPGLLVPAAGLELPIAQLLPLPYDREGYAQSFFPDLAMTRKAVGEGVTVYADSDASLSLYDDGSSEFRRAPAEPAPAAADPVRGLSAAVEFARSHGGWPQGAVLSHVAPLSAARLFEPATVGLRLAFAPRFAGLPLVDAPPWLVLDWVPGLAPEVRSYRRLFAAVEEFPDFRMPVVEAVRVLDAAAGLGPEALPPAARRAVAVDIGYRLDENRLLLPAWVIALADGSRLVYDGFTAGPLPRFWGRRDAPPEER